MTFGPGSILWECYGSRLGYLNAPRAGLLQLAYPDLGRGVEQHSDFYNEPWERLFRSVPQIIGTIFDGPAAQPTADKIREYHKGIKGAHEDGQRYHALDPDTYFWAHATFIETVIASHDLFGKPFTLAEKRLLYLEGIQWWQMYGLSMRPVPPSYDEFVEYWDRTLQNVLAPTVAASRFVEMLRDPKTMDQPWIPDPLWRLLASPGVRSYRWVAVGTFPVEIRELFGFSWSRADQVAFDAVRTAVRRTWPLLPSTVRHLAPARAAYKREGQLGLDVAFERAARRLSDAAA